MLSEFVSDPGHPDYAGQSEERTLKRNFARHQTDTRYRKYYSSLEGRRVHYARIDFTVSISLGPEKHRVIN